VRPIRAVLFDFGHTLFDNDSSVDFLVRESATLGSPLARDEAGTLFAAARARGRTPDEMAKGRDLSPARHRACWLALWAELDARCPGLAEHLYVHETSAAGWTPYPDAREVLECLRAAEIPLAVVSDTGWDIRPVFAAHGFAGHFETFVLSYEVGSTKPAAILFETASERLGVPPGEILMVGDNHLTDGGAIDLGYHVLLLPPVPSGSTRGLRAVLSLAQADGLAATT
jgi:putative hydrolase of the HAD superfamily